MEAIRIVLAVASMLLVMMMMIIISSASVELTEEAPSPSPSSTPTAAASAPLHRSDFLFTMQFCIGNRVVSGMADTGSGLIWTNNSQLLLDDPVMSCGGITSPSCGGLCTFENKYGSGKVRGVKGKGKLTFGGGCGSAATPAPASSGIVVNYDSPYPIIIGSAIMFDNDCHQQQRHHLSSSSDDDVLLLTGDENKAACRAYARGGIVGLNRGPLSLVTQLGFHRFSYCLPHYRHTSGADDAKKTTIVDGQIKFNDAAAISGARTISLSKNSLYYVVGLKQIRVGKSEKRIVKNYDCSLNMDPSSTDAGAMTIDSGTTYTTLPKEVFKDVKKHVRELLEEKLNVKEEERRSIEEYEEAGFSCYRGEEYRYPRGMESIVLDLCSKEEPGIVQLEIPPENYFLPRKDGYCLAFTSTTDSYTLLGAYQQQDMDMLFDIPVDTAEEGNSLSFAKREACGAQSPKAQEENHAAI